MNLKHIYCLGLTFMFLTQAHSQKITIDRNKPERKEWFAQHGYGLHLNLSIDCQLGQHAMEGLSNSSKEYQDWYFNELPMTFNPVDYDPELLAVLAKLSGIDYIIITARQFDGFCFWDTKTTDFNIMNSGYGKDILKETIESLRRNEIAFGLFFSPDDYHFMSGQGYQLGRDSPESSSTINTALWENNKKQLSELLSNYGPIDLLFIDEKSDWANILVANHVWNTKPDIIVTGGGMEIAENYVPQKNIPSEWLGYFSIEVANRWEPDKRQRNALEIIRLLIETRSKGGNFLLTIATNPYGKIINEQEEALRNVGLWYRINKAALANVKPLKINYENGCHFTSSNNSKNVYAFLDETGWKPLEEKAFFFRSFVANKETKVSVLGQMKDSVLGTNNISLTPIVSMAKEGFFMSIVKSNGLVFDDNLPIVINLENVMINE